MSSLKINNFTMKNTNIVTGIIIKSVYSIAITLLNLSDIQLDSGYTLISISDSNIFFLYYFYY